MEAPLSFNDDVIVLEKVFVIGWRKQHDSEGLTTRDDEGLHAD